MADLEAVIDPDSSAQIEEVTDDACGAQSPTTEDGETVPDPMVQSRSTDEDEDFLPSEWPPQVHDHIAGNFSDGFHIGGVLEVLDDETVKVSYMLPKRIATAHPMEHKRRFWMWPSEHKLHDTKRCCIINLRPFLVLQSPPSSKRNFIFTCLNAELLEANSVTEELVEE